MAKQIYLLLFIIFLSCKENSGSEIENTYSKDKKSCSLKLIDSIRFTIDNTMSYRFISHQIIKKGSSNYLAVGDLNTNGISIFSFKDKKIIQKIIFKYTGPNAIDAQTGRSFYYHNKDSIFIFNGYVNMIYLSNDKGIIYDKYNISQNKDILGETIVTNRFMPSFYNKVLNICLYPIISPYRKKEKCTDPIYTDYDIYNKTNEIGKLTYEYAHQKNRHPIYQFPSRIDDSLRLVFLHPFKSELKIYDKTTETFSTKKFESKYIKEYTPFLDSFDKMKRFDVECTVNDVLFYSKTLKTFYAITKLSIPFINPATGRENAIRQKPFLVSVFDKDLNKISEHKFEGSKYLIQNSFAGPKGLYLCTNNPFNPNFNENTYSYDIYSCK